MSSGRPGLRSVPGSTRAPLALSGFLPYRLSVLSAVVSEGLACTYSERFGFGVPEWRVLATVAEFGSVTAKMIGHHAHMNKVTVSRAAVSLEARNLIHRNANAKDLREAFITLTDEGKSVYDQIASLAVDYVNKLTNGLSFTELSLFDYIVDKLIHKATEIAQNK